MDPTTVIAITSLSTVGIAVLGKILYTLRHNVKNLCGIQFRTPDSTIRNSPRNIELNNVRNHLENTLPVTDVIKVIPNTFPTDKELEQKLKIMELENKIKHFEEDNSERVYI